MIMLALQALAVVVVVIGCVVVGKWLGGKVFKVKKDVSGFRKACQILSIACRERGLDRTAEALEAVVVGDLDDIVQAIKNAAIIVKSGNDAIVKELDKAFERSLIAKAQTPEGRAVIRAKVDAAEKVAVEVAKVAGPIVLTAALL